VTDAVGVHYCIASLRWVKDEGEVFGGKGVGGESMEGRGVEACAWVPRESEKTRAKAKRHGKGRW
jgi:carboxylesterase type B